MPHRNVPLGRLLKARLADLFPRGYPVSQTVQPVVILGDDEGKQTVRETDATGVPRVLFDSGIENGNTDIVAAPPAGRIWEISAILIFGRRGATVISRDHELFMRQFYLDLSGAVTNSVYYFGLPLGLTANQVGSKYIDATGHIRSLLAGAQATPANVYVGLPRLMNGGAVGEAGRMEVSAEWTPQAAEDQHFLIVWGREGAR